MASRACHPESAEKSVNNSPPPAMRSAGGPLVFPEIIGRAVTTGPEESGATPMTAFLIG
jgi:hypothetical protein